MLSPRSAVFQKLSLSSPRLTRTASRRAFFLKILAIGMSIVGRGKRPWSRCDRQAATPSVSRANPDWPIGISYPNEADIAFAEALGRPPGKDIFIHGGPRPGVDPMDVRDWTAGCISVSDRQIEEIYAMVRNGTPIDIYA